jgi:O-antigen/teichoic acid export membrane protein
MVSYASKVLLPQGIGKVSSAQNIAQYFVLIASLGLPAYGTKRIASCCGDQEQINKTYSELFFINMCSTFICSIAYYGMLTSVLFYRERFPVYAATGLAILFNFFNIDWYYQGTEEYKYIMLRSLMVKILSLIFLVLYVRTDKDWVAYALILTLSKVANYLFNIVHVRKRVKLQLIHLDIKQHIKPVFILLAAAVAVEIYTLADTTMLTFMCGDEIVGYYSNSIKCISVIRTLIAAVCATFLPRLSYYYAQKDYAHFHDLITRGFKIILTFTLPAAIGCALVSDDFIPLLYGSNFMGSITTTKILSISIVTVAFSNFIGYQILVTVGKEKIMLISTIVGAVVNVILNYFLIGRFKQNGAALASVITEGAVALIQLLSIRKIVKLGPIVKRCVIPSAVGSLLMAGVLFILKPHMPSGIIRLCVCILLGMVIYAVVNILLKNDLITFIVGKAKKQR